MIDLELYILFSCCLGFTFFYELFRLSQPSARSEEGSQLEAKIFGIFGSFFWIILSLVYFVGAAIQSRPYIVSLFFMGIGIIYIVRWMIDLLNIGKWSKELGEIET